MIRRFFASPAELQGGEEAEDFIGHLSDVHQVKKIPVQVE